MHPTTVAIDLAKEADTHNRGLYGETHMEPIWGRPQLGLSLPAHARNPDSLRPRPCHAAGMTRPHPTAPAPTAASSAACDGPSCAASTNIRTATSSTAGNCGCPLMFLAAILASL